LQRRKEPVIREEVLIAPMHNPVIIIDGDVIERVVAIYAPHRLDVAKRPAVRTGTFSSFSGV
jgi:hypothetical protein